MMTAWGQIKMNLLLDPISLIQWVSQSDIMLDQ